MTVKNSIFKSKPKILLSAGIALLLLTLIPFLVDYRDFFLFAGISFLVIGIIAQFFHPKIVYRNMQATYGITAKARQKTFSKQGATISTKQPVTLLLLVIIIGGFLVNQLLFVQYKTQITASTSVEPAANISNNSLNPIDQSLVAELQQQGKEIPIVGTAHNHANLNVYINGERLVLAKPENYMKSAFLHLDNNQNINDAGSVLHMHAKKVPLWLFFRSLGVNLTRDSLTLADGQVLKNENGKTLKFYLDGKKVDELGNYSFQPLDKLLISYGPENDPNVEQQIKAMTNFAKNHQK